MKKLTVIMTSTAVALLCAGAASADVPPGAGQAQYSLFEQIDQNGDGIISDSEFQQYSLQGQDRQQLFSIIDQNSDGQISQSEWQAYKDGEIRAEQPRAMEEPMPAEPAQEEEERGFTGDVWDEQTYDVNDPVKIEPEREGETTQ